MFQNHKEAVITLSVLAVLVAGTAAYYLWPEREADAERPPSLVINVPKLQGRNANDAVCISGMLPIDPGYDGYFAPPGDPAAPRPNRKDPKTPPAIGTHLYYATETMSVQKLINSIVPVEGGQVLFAFYSPGVEATAGSVAKEKGWHLFPDSVSESTSVDAGGEATHGIEDPTSYQIAPYEGFVVFSCKPTEIHNVKSETDIPKGMPVHLIKIDEGWVLVPEFFSYLSNVSDTTEEGKRAALFSLIMDWKLKAIWLQAGKGFSFPASTPNDQVAAKFAPDAEIPVEYRMIWVKLGEPARAQRDGRSIVTAAEIAALAAVRESGLTGDAATAYVNTFIETYEAEIVNATRDGSEVTDEEVEAAIAIATTAAEVAADAATDDVSTDPGAERQPVEPPQRPGEPPTRPGGQAGEAEGPSRPSSPSRPTRPGGPAGEADAPSRPSSPERPTRPTRPGGELPVSTLRAVENLKAIPCHKSVKLTWDPVSSDDAVDGYIIRYGLMSGLYLNQQDVEDPSVSDATISDLDNDKTYYFAMITRDANDNEGPLTTEVNATPSLADVENCPRILTRPTEPVRP